MAAVLEKVATIAADQLVTIADLAFAVAQPHVAVIVLCLTVLQARALILVTLVTCVAILDMQAAARPVLGSGQLVVPVKMLAMPLTHTVLVPAMAPVLAVAEVLVI
jgi:hypothetical protein